MLDRVFVLVQRAHTPHHTTHTDDLQGRREGVGIECISIIFVTSPPTPGNQFLLFKHYFVYVKFHVIT